MHTGVVAEFRTPEEMLHALRELRRRGYERLDAFMPYPVKGVEDAAGISRSPLTWMVLPVAMAGTAFGFLAQLYCNAFDYPINVGGRPLNSAPAFIPITFETGVLTAALAGVFIFLGLCNLPQLHAPVADVEGFERATIDRFWVGVDDRDRRFDAEEIGRMLKDLGAISVGHARRRTG
jgi:hypothetical protein